MQKMSYVALMDAIREGFYWDYVLITVGWCNYADGKDIYIYINRVNLERRVGMCWMHQDYSTNSDDSEGDEIGDDGEIRLV